MIFAVGDGNEEHNLVELFSFSGFKWQIKEEYPYAEDIHHYALLVSQKKFILFGGRSRKRRLLKN